jgi:hypothetical protein
MADAMEVEQDFSALVAEEVPKNKKLALEVRVIVGAGSLFVGRETRACNREPVGCREANETSGLILWR